MLAGIKVMNEGVTEGLRNLLCLQTSNICHKRSSKRALRAHDELVIARDPRAQWSAPLRCRRRTRWQRWRGPRREPQRSASAAPPPAPSPSSQCPSSAACVARHVSTGMPYFNYTRLAPRLLLGLRWASPRRNQTRTRDYQWSQIVVHTCTDTKHRRPSGEYCMGPSMRPRCLRIGMQRSGKFTPGWGWCLLPQSSCPRQWWLRWG